MRCGSLRRLALIRSLWAAGIPICRSICRRWRRRWFEWDRLGMFSAGTVLQGRAAVGGAEAQEVGVEEEAGCAVGMKIDSSIRLADLMPQVTRLFELAGRKVRQLDEAWDPSKGTP